MKTITIKGWMGRSRIKEGTPEKLLHSSDSYDLWVFTTKGDPTDWGKEDWPPVPVTITIEPHPEEADQRAVDEFLKETRQELANLIDEVWDRLQAVDKFLKELKEK